MSMRRLVGMVAAVALACGGAAASPLDGDSNAMPGWSGSVFFDDGEGLEATVEYAVYAPGDFSYAGYTPTPGEYVYAYQVFNTGSVEINTFALAMLDSNEANNQGTFDAGNGGVATTGMVLNAFNAQWSWVALGGLTVEHSVGLVYSSINEPLTWRASVADGGSGANGWLPSPSNVIPEPATMALLGVAAVGLLRRKR